MRHQLLGVILSGPRRIGNKPSHQEVHKETRGKHRRIKLTILEIHSLFPSHGLSHSLSAYKSTYLAPSLSPACLHVVAAMCVCESSRPCKSGLGCVGVCVDVCERIFFRVCILSLHVCAYIGVLYTYMHACMHVHRFTYPCDTQPSSQPELLPLLRARKQRNPCSVLKLSAEYLIPDFFFPMEV